MKKPLSITEEGLKLYAEIAENLVRGAREREHPFHLISLATLGLDSTPRARMVVLRQYLTDEHVLLFHSDRRSPKIHEIFHNPGISLLCYDTNERTQLRMSATAKVHAADALYDACWLACPVQSRQFYLSPLPPSTIIDYPRQPLPKEREWTLQDDRQARQHFCVVSCSIHAIDYLELGDEGNRRMNLFWDEQGQFSAQALMP